MRVSVLGWAVCFDYAYHQSTAEYLLAHGAQHDVFTATAMGDTQALRAVLGQSPHDVDTPEDLQRLNEQYEDEERT